MSQQRLKSVNKIIAKDNNPSKALLKKEFMQKLKGIPTQRDLRKAMLQATTVRQIEQIVNDHNLDDK